MVQTEDMTEANDTPKDTAETARPPSRLLALSRGVGAAIKVLISFAGAAIVLMVLSQIVHDTLTLSFDIKPVTVPDALEKAGYKPDVVSRKLADELDRIEHEATTGHRRPALYFDRPPLDLTMPGLGFSVSSISSYVKTFLSLEEVIVCDVAIENNQYMMTIRDRPSSRTQRLRTVRAATLDDLITSAAKEILSLTDPYVLASYVRQREPREAIALLREVVGHGSAEDVVWGYMMWGLIERGNDHLDDGIRYYLMALEEYRAIPWYRRWFTSTVALASAYNNLAIAYRAKNDPALSMTYLRMAVDLRLPGAETNLGERYLEPYGVERDPKAAEMWFERAAARGWPEADYQLALLRLDGTPEGSVRRDAFAGITGLRRAAVHGSAGAEARLGAEYLFGSNIPVDQDEAKYWLGLAAAHGNAEAKHRLEALKQQSECTDKC